MPPSETAALPPRVANSLAVYEALRRTPLRTRAELADEIGLSKPTVGAALQVLVHGRLIRERGHAVGRRGPRAILYETCQGEPAVMAIDVGWQRVRGIIADIDGGACLSAEVTVRTPNAEHVLKAVELLHERFISVSPEIAIVGSPGVVDPSSGKIRLCSEIQGWNGLRLEAAIGDLVGCDVVVENDVNLAAIGEHGDGAGRECDSFVYLAIGPVITAGLILDGRLHRGRHGAAGLLGFLPFAPREIVESELDSEDPTRLRRVDARSDLPPMARLLSRDAMLTLARTIDPALDVDMDMLLAGGMDGRADDHVPPSLGLPLAAVIAAVTAITDIEMVLLGGEHGARAKPLIAPTVEHLTRLVPYAPQIRLAELGDLATLRGAAARGAEIARQRMVVRAIQELADASL